MAVASNNIVVEPDRFARTTATGATTVTTEALPARVPAAVIPLLLKPLTALDPTMVDNVGDVAPVRPASDDSPLSVIDVAARLCPVQDTVLTPVICDREPLADRV